MTTIQKIKKYWALPLLAVVAACTGDFEDVNTNPLLPNAHQRTLDGLASGGLFPGFIQKVKPTRTPGQGTDYPNRYQVAQNIAGDNWIGYMSPGHSKWNQGKNYTNYFNIIGWTNYTFETGIPFIINPYMEIKAALHDVVVNDDGTLTYNKKDLVSQSSYAVAQIVKVMGIHRATDQFGPIPYSQIGAGKFTVAYDSQEQVYRSFLAELEEAVITLQSYLDAGGTKLLEEYDPVYQGNTAKWIKLGNSLMLRLAIRVRYADQALATEYASKAINHKGGLLAEKNDAATLQNNGKFMYYNSLELLWNDYNDAKMGATIYSYLKGYNDPRMDKYFTKATAGGTTEDFFAVRTGIRHLADGGTYAQFSRPLISTSTPTYWMKASEIQFLLAEAALFGITTGDPKALYERGIALSFEENDLTVGNYATTTGKPVNYVDSKIQEYSIQAVSTIDKVWMANGSDEEKLEQIITQKYLAIYPDGQEAWSEWRRTGYPRQFPIPSNVSNMGARNINGSGTDGGMRRLPYPDSEIRLNADNLSKAVTLLGGADRASTNVWWDKKSKN
ncbi:MAG: SusD/RagB family nutrient-binding outer membrane lipoprotein [Capnocytophaga sp.]|nr:SusD/RagB family nutrient-binding outer membrane lipoprotein [Capnocytophaga sp.]